MFDLCCTESVDQSDQVWGPDRTTMGCDGLIMTWKIKKKPLILKILKSTKIHHVTWYHMYWLRTKKYPNKLPTTPVALESAHLTWQFRRCSRPIWVWILCPEPIPMRLEPSCRRIFHHITMQSIEIGGKWMNLVENEQSDIGHDEKIARRVNLSADPFRSLQ